MTKGLIRSGARPPSDVIKSDIPKYAAYASVAAASASSSDLNTGVGVGEGDGSGGGVAPHPLIITTMTASAAGSAIRGSVGMPRR